MLTQILMLFYGIPKAIKYTRKGILKKNAYVFYLKSFLIWFIIFTGVAFFIAWFFPNLTKRLLESNGFIIGQLIGLVVALFGNLSSSGRKGNNADFWDNMANYTTKEFTEDMKKLLKNKTYSTNIII